MSLGPCNACGAWAPGASECPSCGASLRPRAPLDRARGDGRSIVVLEGPAGAVGEALAGVGPDGSERILAARTLVGRLSGPVRCALDLRPPEAGHVVRRARAAGGTDVLLVLPWLVIHHGGGEVRAVRTARPQGKAARDEVVIATPAGGWRGPLAMALRAAPIPDGAPRPGPLPPTVPDGDAAVAVGLGRGAVLALGLVVALVLVQPGRPTPPPLERALDALAGEYAREVVAAAVASPDVGLPIVRGALVDPRPECRESALAAAGVLPRPERLRQLEGLARSDASHRVRSAARQRLAREGDAGATRLLALARRGDQLPADRAVALTVAIDLDPPRAAATAIAITPGAPVGLRPVLARALAGGGPPMIPAIDRLIDDDDLATRAAAAWARCSVADVDAAAARRIERALWAALDRGAARPRSPTVEAAQVALVRAAERAGVPPTTLRAASHHPGATLVAGQRLRSIRDRP